MNLEYINKKYAFGGKEEINTEEINKISQKFHKDVMSKKLHSPKIGDIIFYNVWRAMAPKGEGMKKTKKQIEDDSRRVAANIAYYQRIRRTSDDRCALALDMSVRTYKRRISAPGSFTVDELATLANLLNTTSQMLQFGKLEAEGVA